MKNDCIRYINHMLDLINDVYSNRNYCVLMMSQNIVMTFEVTFLFVCQYCV